MSFLAPLFLAGAAAIALPVLFHLIRRSTRQRTLFSSLLLLEASPPRMRRRSRLEDVLLLLLRCLALLLLALGFARPYLRDPTFAPPATETAQRVILLVDVSASMQRSGVWNAAIASAERQASRLGAGDLLSLVTFGHDAQTLVTFEAWKATPAGQRAALVAARLRDTGPGWSDTRLANALIHAAESLTERADDAPSLNRRIVLVSDVQEGSRLDQLQAYEWPKGVTLQIDRVEPTHRVGNAGIQLLADVPMAPGATNPTVRVRVANTTDATENRFEVGWVRAEGSSFLGAPQEIHVPPGANRVVAVPVPAGVPVDRLQLRGDAEAFDNLAFVVPPTATRVQWVHVGDDPGDDPKQPLFFLRRAFPATNQLGVTIRIRRLAEPWTAEDARSTLIVATDALPPATADALHQAAADGGTVLFPLRAATPAIGATLGRLLGREAPAIEEAAVRNYAMLGELDFRHPLLAPFADPRFSDFTKIHFWHHRRFDPAGIPGARVIARFDSGDAAWTEVPVGRGRVFVFAGGWQPEDSQLAVSSKFVPLLYAMMESGGTTLNPAGRSSLVGEALVFPAPVGPRARLTLPDGSSVTLAPGATNFTRVDRPGIYRLVSEDDRATVAFAVNLDPTESRTAPLALDQLESLGVVLREPTESVARSAERTAELAAVEVENRQKLWRWVLLITLAALFLESALAGWTSRRLARAGDARDPSATSTPSPA